jgi:HK97 family phage portal protein
VTQSSSLTNATVYACVRILAETVASLPLIVYRRLERGKERAEDYYLYEILHDRPNPLMTSFELRETLQGHLALWGNSYCEIDYDSAGRVTALWPLRPDKVLNINKAGETVSYEYQLPDGKTTWLSGSRVWHIRGLSGDGLRGMSPIELMRNSIGLSMAAEKYGSKFFGNNARPSGVLQHPGVLGDEAAKQLRESWNEMHMGLDNAQRVAILEEGMTYNQIGIPPEDAQFLETRKFQMGEIARAYRIPPHMIGDLDRATFNNIEHQGIEFVTHTIRPWLVRWEQSISRDLMTETERKKYFAEFLVDALLRGDTMSRYQAYAIGFQNGWLSQNDIRERENMNPIEGGDDYYVPLNLASSTEVGGKDEGEEGRGVFNAKTQRRKGLEYELMLAGSGSDRRALEQGIRGRRRAFEGILPVFADAIARVLRRERNDVGSQARKMLAGAGPAEVEEFKRWLDEFYDQHAEFARKQLQPGMESYARQVLAAVEDELEELRKLAAATGVAEPGEATMEQMQGYVDSYTAQYGVRHATRSLTWMLDAINGALPGEELQAVEAKFEDWGEWRADNSAHEEATRASNAVAKAAYRTAGIVRMRSMAFGESCPYCRGLDGVIVGIDQVFLEAGVPFQPEGALTPLVVGASKGHAPYHDGCDCMVLASL